MNDNLKEIEHPIGYIRNRRISVMLFFIAVYLFCAIFLLMKFNIIPKERYSVASLVNYAVFIFSVVSMIYVNLSKKYYKKLIVPKYNEINVHGKKEIIMYLIPIIISMYFMLFQVIGYLCLLGTIYIGIDRFNKPYDPTEQKL
jgi:hypothetical protein